jgi:hypothetical protein
VLTTKNAQDIRENISTTNQSVQSILPTDLNGNVAAPQAGKKAVVSPEWAILHDASIVARPLMVPEVCSVHVKNLEYQYRWVFKDSRGLVYMQRRAQGFTNATTDDVDVLGGDITANNSEIMAGDVILMKIRKDLYEAAMKWNMQKALSLQRSRGMYLQGASSDVNSDVKATPVTINQEVQAGAGPSKRTAPSFIPDNPDAMFGGVKTNLAAAEVARRQTAAIREHFKADPKTTVVGEKVEGS